MGCGGGGLWGWGVVQDCEGDGRGDGCNTHPKPVGGGGLFRIA
jgi:hypothetical protein